MINMSMTKLNEKVFSSEIVNLDDMIPKNHFLRVIKENSCIKVPF